MAKAKGKPKGVVPDELRCQFVSGEGKGCAWSALRGQPLCHEHSRVGQGERREIDALGGKEIVEQVRQELGVGTETLETLPASAAPSSPAEVLKARQAAKKPPAVEKTKRAVHSSATVTDVVKEKLAAQKMAAEQRKKLRELRRLGLQIPETPLTKTVARRQGLPDPTYIPNEMLNKDAHGRYWIPRWVYTRRPDGQSRHQRLADLKLYGAEPIMGNSKLAESTGYDLGRDGVHLKGCFGEAWQVPVDGAADRIIDKSQDGAFNVDDLVEKMQDQAEQINSAMGRDAVGVVWAGEEHGDRSSL